MTEREGVGSWERERGRRERGGVRRRGEREIVGERICDGATHTSSKHVLRELIRGYRCIVCLTLTLM